jgi:hypothetical protein
VRPLGAIAPVDVHVHGFDPGAPAPGRRTA